MIYFAYGANLCRAHMNLWCPGSEPLATASLPDHRLVLRFWADLEPSPHDRVLGALYEVPEADLASLDEYEDCPELYERVALEVRTADGPVGAITYRMHEGYAFAPPAPEYLALIQQGYEDWGLDPEALPLKTVGQA